MSTGFDKQVGFITESSYGVPLAVTKFVPFVDESLGQDVQPVKSKGVLAGARLMRSQQWSPGNVEVGGDLGLEVDNATIATLFKHMFGTVVTTGAGPYTHTFSPGALDGKSLTIQKGIPGSSGTVFPMTYAGCKIASWELACAVGEIATLGLTFVGRQEIGFRTVADGATTNANPAVTSATAAFGPDDLWKPISGAGIPANSYIGVVNSATSVGLSSSNVTNTPVNATATASGVTLTLGIALASASYTAGIQPMSYVDGSISIGGSVANVNIPSFKLSGDNKLSPRRFIGRRLIDEPLEGAGLREITGSVDLEFYDRTQYNRYVQANEFAMVFHLQYGAATLDATINAAFRGETPKMSASDFPVVMSMPIDVIGTTTDALGITVVLVNADSSAA